MTKLFIDCVNFKSEYSRNVFVDENYVGIEVQDFNFNADGFRTEVATPIDFDIDNIVFVHGSKEELLSGKTCVMRNNVRWSETTRTVVKTCLPVFTMLKPFETIPFKSIQTKYGKFVVLGRTGSFNFKIKVFK